MKLRNYKITDNEELVQLFYDTVHAVGIQEYTQAEVDAWAPEQIDTESWCQFFSKDYTLIAEDAGTITGFGNITKDGYFDRLYVHKEYQRMGIAAMIAEALEAYAAERGIEEIGVHASKTSRRFFEQRGYEFIQEHVVERGGQKLVNYEMKLHI